MAEPRIPRYQQVFNELKHQIDSHELAPGTALPSLEQLVDRYSTSAITIRRALADLVEEGLIYRVRGKGTFVRDDSTPATPPEKASEELKRMYLGLPGMRLPLLDERYYSDLLSGIEQYCTTQGIELFIWNYEKRPNFPEGKHIGVILLPHPLLPVERLRQWKRENRRIVTVHFHYPHLDIPYVVIDNLTGGYLATQHLLTLGHQRIGIVLTGHTLNEMNQDFALRLQGYRLALQLNGIAIDEQLIVIMPGVKESEEMGREGIRLLLGLEEPPTAVFATSDVKAVGCMLELEERGIRMPEQMSLVGFDDIRIAPFVYPGLTTVNQNTHQMGLRAAELLHMYPPGPQSAIVKEEIVPTLVVRGSASPLAVRTAPAP